MNSYGDLVTLVHAPLVTGYGGQKVRDWPNATRTYLAAAVQPRRGTEQTTGMQVTTTSKTVHCAPDAGVAAVDRIEWRGATYEVSGEPETHYSGGMADHLEFIIELIAEAAA